MATSFRFIAFGTWLPPKRYAKIRCFRQGAQSGLVPKPPLIFFFPQIPTETAGLFNVGFLRVIWREGSKGAALPP